MPSAFVTCEPGEIPPPPLFQRGDNASPLHAGEYLTPPFLKGGLGGILSFLWAIRIGNRPGKSRNPRFLVSDVPRMFAVFEEPKILRLGVGDGAEILHGRVKRPVFHPGFSRALFAQPLEKTAGAAAEIFGIRCPPFPQARKVFG